MATITDRQGHVIARVDVETGAFTWEARELAPQVIRDLIDAPMMLDMTGGTDTAGREYSEPIELAKGTAEWAAALEYRIPILSEDRLEWHD